MSVKRLYVAKRKEHAVESAKLLNMLKSDNGADNLEDLIILNRYDIEGLRDDELELAVHTVFSEPMTDDLYREEYPFGDNAYFSVEYLPGQFDQRSDSAEQCVQVITGVSSVIIRSAKTYVLKGNLTDRDIDEIKNIIINPVDQRLASEEKPDTLIAVMPKAEPVKTIDGFIDMNDMALSALLSSMGLAMSLEDIKFSKNYFKDEEKRNPTEAELRLLDTYWSDHCRHTTFNTVIKNIEIEKGTYKELFEDTLKLYFNIRKDIYGDKISEKPVTLMDLAVIGAKDARKKGLLANLEESDENNACSIEIDVNIGERKERWLLQFKNETHNHPTEIEPFGGAATCVGGAIRDPLSGRAYVYQSMRITGAADPRKPVPEYLKGKKLSQRKITSDAARGFSSYGNQIGLATGYVQEFYHDGFLAKRLETGAVIGAVPKKSVRREKAVPGDLIILLGGRTGRDGVGGATGSSKEHDASSIEICGAEVQKGNAPEEHKIQRLFRKENVSLMIKKCNDFGAGGVGVAIGELADGITVDLNAVPKKYEGLTGTEIALSESQERMAAVIAPCDLDRFMAECSEENLEAAAVARVTDTNRLTMVHDGVKIIDISRKFLDSAGAVRYQNIKVADAGDLSGVLWKKKYGSFKELIKNTLSDLNVCSQKGLVEMFDSTVGASSVLTAFGGKYGNTPSQAMAAKIPAGTEDTSTLSLMASGYNPYIMERSPYHGAFFAVIESVSKILALGGYLEDIHLSFQEYFERLGSDPIKWGKPFAALLGALKAQNELGIAAIGGKDSMSGTFKDNETGTEINVPPVLISFAVAQSDISRIVTAEFKENSGDIYLLKTPVSSDNLPDLAEFKKNAAALRKLIADNAADSVYAVTFGGVAEVLCKLSFGNMTGLSVENIDIDALSQANYGSFILQLKKGYEASGIRNMTKIAVLNKNAVIECGGESVSLKDALSYWSEPLEQIFPASLKSGVKTVDKRDFGGCSKLAKSNITVKPEIALPALPGTNCEYDTKRIFELAGSREVTPFIFKNMTSSEAAESCSAFADIINRSQILAIPGGFSAGDEPEGSGKFFVSVLKNAKVRDAVDNLINKRDGLIIGICNGFQALIKTGILTRGYICDLTSDDATLSFNLIGRHVSQMVRTRVSSLNSPWMRFKQVGDIDIVPVSHGEGRFTAPKKVIDELFEKGQVLFQYADLDGNISMEFPFNPNGSDMAIEGICSPCGRVLGKMGHSERAGAGIHINNAYGNMDQRIFEAGVKYFTGKE